MPYTAMEMNTALKLDLIAKRAKREPKTKFTSLMHLLNISYLMECYKMLKIGKAAGVDGRSLESYSEEEMRQSLEEVIGKIKQKRYKPQAVRRVYIEKANGKKRPLGIPSVVDKVIQVGMTRILEAIYEADFLEESYGYRKGKGAHDALKEINHMIMGQKVNWIIDADIQGFFDNLDHQWMIRCLDERIADPNFKLLVRKFLKAGVLEEGQLVPTTEGTPQGGIVSPVLANIYLHYGLDLWIKLKVKKEKVGYIQLVRYADDFVIGVQYRQEALALRKELDERLNKFGLNLSEEKTRVIEFGRFAKENREKRTKTKRKGEGKANPNNTKGEAGTKPATFDFLGFTHYCNETRDGRYKMQTRTSRKKLNMAIKGMNSWLKSVRNKETVKEIWEKTKTKLQGHYNYYGVSGNFDNLQRYYYKVNNLLFKWINRKSQKRSWNWSEYRWHLNTYPLPKPKLTYAIYNTW